MINDVLPSPPASPASINAQLPASQNDDNHVLSQMQNSQSRNERWQQRFPHNTSPPTRRQRMRNDRGLLSTTGMLNVIDNRYMLLNLPEEESAKMEPPVNPVRRSNFAISHKIGNHSKKGLHFAGNSAIKHTRPTKYRTNEATGYENNPRPPYDASHSNYEQFVCDDIDQDDNLDALDDIPAYDDIPYALLITGSLDETTIKKARQKQNQRVALEQIKQIAEMKSRTRGISNNKNLGYANNRKQPVTHSAQDGTSIKMNTEEQLDLLNDYLSQTGDDSLVSTEESLKKSAKLQNQSMDDYSNPEDRKISDTNSISPYESANDLMKTLGAMHRDICASQSSREDIDFRKKKDKDIDEAKLDASFERMLSCTDKSPTVDKRGDNVMTVQGPLSNVSEKMVSEPISSDLPTETPQKSDSEIIPTQTLQTRSNIETDAHASSETNAAVDDALKEFSGDLVKTGVEVLKRYLEGADGFGNNSNFSNNDNDEHEGGPILKTASPTTDQSTVQFAESSYATVYPKSPINHQDTKGNKESTILSATQIKMVNQSYSKEVNLEVDAHSCALGNVVSDRGDISSPISKASNDHHKDQEHPIQRKETDKEKFIRMKRLERLEAMNINAQQQKDIQIKPTKKPDDHRNKTVHIDDTSKPVKAKVFKNKTSSFGISETSSDTNKSPLNALNNERKQQFNARSNDNEVTRRCTNNDQAHDDHCIMKTPLGISNDRKSLGNKTTRPSAEIDQPKGQHNKSVKPSALKLLQSRTMLSTSSDKHEEKTSNDYSEPKQERATNAMRTSLTTYGKTKLSQEKKPATMRFLERMKKRTSRKSVLSSLEDSERPEKNKIKEPKGKNKNLTSGGVNSSNGYKVVSETKNDDQDIRPSTVLSNSFETAEEKANSAAKLRHEAFRILAAVQSGNQIKCSGKCKKIELINNILIATGSNNQYELINCD